MKQKIVNLQFLKIKAAVSGRSVYLRFQSATGDAMGMNMVTKGVEKALQFLEQQFPDLDCLRFYFKIEKKK